MSLLSPNEIATSIHFGSGDATGEVRTEYELDPVRLELRCRGRRVDLRRQAIQVLVVLVENEGRLVPAETLRQALWGDQQLEWRNSLHQCVRDLRRALSDDARRPRFVATVARVGYRFVGERMALPEAGPPAETMGWLGQRLRRPTLAFGLGFATAVLLPVCVLILCALLSG